MTRTISFVLLLLCASAATAMPIEYRFSYALSSVFPAFPPPNMTGQLFGELQADGDTIHVDSVSFVEFDGVLVNGTITDNLVQGFPLSTAQPVVSLSGDLMGLDVFSNTLRPFSVNRFLIGTDPFFGGSVRLITGQNSYFQEYRARNWSIEPLAGPIPIAPASALVLTGWLVLLATRRRMP